MSKREPEVSSVEMAELLAAREAIKFALEVGFREVILEGDSISFMNAIQMNEDGWPEEGALVTDIRALACSCPFIEFPSVKWDSNMVVP